MLQGTPVQTIARLGALVALVGLFTIARLFPPASPPGTPAACHATCGNHEWMMIARTTPAAVHEEVCVCGPLLTAAMATEPVFPDEIRQGTLP